MTAFAAIVDDAGLDGPALLAKVLERGGFWDILSGRTRALRLEPADLRIIIKPELRGFDVGSPGITDPVLVEALVDLLHDRRFTNVGIGAAPDASSIWAENRDVAAAADLLGYHYVTAKGRSYDVLDLSQDLVPAAFPPGAVLHGSSISRAWADAHVRICFAKNKTDGHNGYALSVEALLDVLPRHDKDYHYRHSLDPGDAVAELLCAFPVEFALIDATVSAHGSGGTQAPTPIPTSTMIGSSNVLLADLVGALKMGLDPFVSPLNAKVMKAVGLPSAYRIEGNLATYPGWINVHPLIADSARRRDAWLGVSRTVAPWLQTLNPELFPLKNPIDAKANTMVAPFVARVDQDHGAFWTLVGANYGLSWIHYWLENYRLLFNKDALRRRRVPLNLNLMDVTNADCETSRAELLPLAELLAAAPADGNGLRWRYLDRAVLFEIEKTLPIRFETFVAKVDVSKTIQLMNDYIGGVAVPIARDDAGRVTHQAERNLYLPQPNYVAMYGGRVIDVTKLEHIEYGADSHRMFWKTIESENGSAIHDDGIVTFRRAGAETHVSIVGRQFFVLPPILEALMLDLHPPVKDALVTDAYTTFFNRTFANFEAVVEGRDIRAGRPWRDEEDPAATEPRPVDAFADLVTKLDHGAGDDLISILMRFMGSPSASGPVSGAEVDANGFTHVTPSLSPAQPTRQIESGEPRKDAIDRVDEFWRELGEAMRRDWRTLEGMHHASDRA